jgi:catechol 2,3-dioxygenase-like lactoylglutathione lyase family enzyme
MNIVGLDTLVFGVDDVEACCQYLTDYGLTPVNVSAAGGEFEALDGTCISIRHREDASLPKALPTASMLRKTIHGCADQATVDAIAEELGKDRDVIRLANGAIESVDDMGFALGFQVTVRKELNLPAEAVNAPGAAPGRAVNVIGADANADIKLRTLSHVVYFVPDSPKAEKFYIERLGFRVADRFTHLGPFLRPQGTQDHHTLFLVHTPPEMQGVEHFTFHLGGPSELLQAGKRFQDKGYESFWGPGRHIYGSNWFWYFNSPMGVHVEYDADMDLHDDEWVARETSANADASQIFNFTLAKNWMPGGDPH